MLRKQLIIVIILIFIIPITPTVSQTKYNDQDKLDNIIYNNTIIEEPLRFWRANPKIFNITDSNIFPMASIGKDGIISNLGISWITWILNFNGLKVPAHAILENGKIRDFTLSDKYYLEVYWHGAAENLFLVTSTNDTTELTLFGYDNKPIKSKLNYYSNGHQILVTKNVFKLFLYQNGTIPTDVTLVGYSLVGVTTESIMISSIPNAAVYKKNNNILFFIDGKYNILPNSFTDNSIVGHVLLTPAIFDIVSEQMWIDGNVIPLPKNIGSIYTYGLKSSIIRTLNNSIYEFGYQGWELIKSFDNKYKIEDFAIIDIGLYIGLIHESGISLLTYGIDEDKDLAPDTLESYYGSYPYLPDSDFDTIPDQIEIAYGLNPLLDDRYLDYDKDLISNIDEINLKLDPLIPDSDFGGAIDGWEVTYGLDPLSEIDDLYDQDGDGVPNYTESIWGSSPFNSDTDGDKMPDKWEINYGLDPTDPDNAFDDNDNDARNNLYEYNHGTNPLIPDPVQIFSGLGFWLLMTFIVVTPIVLKLNKKIFD